MSAEKPVSRLKTVTDPFLRKGDGDLRPPSNATVAGDDAAPSGGGSGAEWGAGVAAVWLALALVFAFIFRRLFAQLRANGRLLGRSYHLLPVSRSPLLSTSSSPASHALPRSDMFPSMEDDPRGFPRDDVEEIQRLMDQGLPFDEARRVLNERRMAEWGVDPATGLARDSGTRRGAAASGGLLSGLLGSWGGGGVRL